MLEDRKSKFLWYNRAVEMITGIKSGNDKQCNTQTRSRSEISRKVPSTIIQSILVDFFTLI